jgi:hypothetical protein
LEHSPEISIVEEDQNNDGSYDYQISMTLTENEFKSIAYNQVVKVQEDGSVDGTLKLTSATMSFFDYNYDGRQILRDLYQFYQKGLIK